MTAVANHNPSRTVYGPPPPRHTFKKLGTEESHVVETFERTVGPTANSEPRREYSKQQWTERRTYGRDQNGDIVVHIEKDPSEPVRPVTPVEAVEGHPRLPEPSEHFSPLPRLAIPRVSTRPNSSAANSSYPADETSPRSVSFVSSDERRSSPAHRTPSREDHQHHLAIPATAVPIKKVTKKSRWVSIYDGRPVSPFVETVEYRPAIAVESPSVLHQQQQQQSSPRPSSTFDDTTWGSRRLGSAGRRTRFQNENTVNQQGHQFDDEDEGYAPDRRSPRHPQHREQHKCAYLVENPLYRNN